MHEVEPDPLPAVEFTYQKFLTPGKNYTPAVPTAPMVGASQAFRSRPAGYCGFFEPEFFLFFLKEFVLKHAQCPMRQDFGSPHVSMWPLGL